VWVKQNQATDELSEAVVAFLDADFDHEGFLATLSTNLAHLDTAIGASPVSQQLAAYESLNGLLGAVVPQQYRSPIFDRVIEHTSEQVGRLERELSSVTA